MRIGVNVTTGHKAIGEAVGKIPVEQRSEAVVRRRQGYVVARTSYGRFVTCTRGEARRNGWEVVSHF